MASPPAPYGYAASPTSPPYASHSAIPQLSVNTMQNRMKRPADGGVGSPSLKRRKASVLSVTSATPSNHPLRQTSFPPDESQAATPRSPSVDTASLVSGSHVSGAPKQRRKRRTKAEIAADAAAREAGRSPSASVVGGKRAGTVVSGVSGRAGGGRGGKRGVTEEQGEEEEDDSGPVIVKKNEEQRAEERIKEQKMRALLQRAMNPDQELRFHMLRGAKLQDATVRRLVNATVSQSVPPNFVTGIRSVAKEFAGDLIEEARRVQGEWEAKGADDGSKVPLEATQPDPRGPLRPEHLIEAWRRYKQNNAGAVGIHGLWHEQQGDGVRRFARRSGKTLFR